MTDQTPETVAVADAASATDMGRIHPIDPLSEASLYLKLYFNDTHLSTATGFIVEFNRRHFLISAHHVFSGRHADTGKCMSEVAAIPNEVRIAHRLRGNHDRLAWRFDREPLFNADGTHRWHSHPAGPEVDVGALELTSLKPDVEITAIPLELAKIDLQLYPSMPVSIIGFPLGIRPGGVFLPIWKTGHIASEPYVDYEENRPAFLIDATTREGMSGSPVVARTHAGFLNARNIWVVGEGRTRWLGVYASRLRENAEIGTVWRPSAVVDVLTNALAISKASRG